MDLADALRLFDGWRERPPIGDMVRYIAMYIGWKPPSRERPAIPQRSFAEQLADTGDMFKGLSRWFPKERARHGGK